MKTRHSPVKAGYLCDRNINRHFDLNSCNHGVKIEVKQVDDNNSWLYNENQ